MLNRVPAEDGVVWRRAWPGGRPGEPERPLVLEGVRPGGRVVAATAEVRVSGGVLTGARVHLVADDHRLPALAAERRAGAAVVGHRAGKRAVLRTGPAHAPREFVKVARPAATRDALERLDAVRAALGEHPDRPGLVEVTARSEGVLRLRPAAGTALSALLGPRAGPAHLVRCRAAGHRTALATGALAAAPAGALPEHDAHREAGVLERWAGDARAFGVLPPPLAGRLVSRAAEVADRLRALPPAPAVASHRDLHDGQVLVRSAPDGIAPGVTFLDVDTAARAHPCLDPANLLAHLDLALVRGAAPAAVAALTAGLREGWAAGGHPLRATGPDALAAWRAAARLRLVAVHAFRGPVDDLATWLG
ncbi:hypothetical protein [Kineococcus sp. G2]|uniref:hypothetical protein n=1 Tax=Kineococcus sp. G2 TaxID=3127484 RepID=UPI00301CDF73